MGIKNIEKNSYNMLVANYIKGFLIQFMVFNFSLIASGLYAQSLCLQFSEVSDNGAEFVVELQMQSSSPFGLGSSNLQFSYNTAALSTPVFDSSPLDIGLGYFTPTVTTPAAGEASFNIVYGGATGAGYNIDMEPAWTNIGRVKFSIVNVMEQVTFSWSYNGGSTQTVVFQDDNATQLFATVASSSCLVPFEAAVPLELLAFMATPKNNSIELDWETLDESNVYAFQVERSENGRGFYHLAQIESYGGQFNSHYAYQDFDIKKNMTYYYRLKIVGHDAGFEYSPIRSARIAGKADGFKLFPNPAGNTLYVELNSEEKENITLEILDGFGRTAMTYDESVTEGNSKIPVDLSSLTSGWYVLRTIRGNENFAEGFYKN